MFLNNICSHNCISNLNKPGCDDQIHLFFKCSLSFIAHNKLMANRARWFCFSFLKDKQLSMMKLTFTFLVDG